MITTRLQLVSDQATTLSVVTIATSVAPAMSTALASTVTAATVTATATVALVNTGLVGSRGEQGLPGSGGALSLFEAAVPLSGHQGIALDANGKAIYASCDNLSHVMKVAGISTGAAAAAAALSVQSKDTLEHAGWSWGAGDPILLGLNGALTNTLPGGAAFLQILGKALAPTRILVGIQPPIIL